MKESEAKNRTPTSSTCWIEKFCKVGKAYGIPEAFLRWGGIYAVSATLGRHVWLENEKGKVFPNLYVFMVAPPAAGKSQVESFLTPLLNDIGVILAPQHCSKASLIDHLERSKVNKTGQGKLLDYHCMHMVTSEFGETFPSYDLHLLSTLARWWDCPSVIKEEKRSQGDPKIIPNVVASMLSGVQPAVLAASFPEEAWKGGFLSRTIFVYEAFKKHVPLRQRPRGKPKQGSSVSKHALKELYTSLGAISKKVGRMYEDETFVEEYFNWIDTDQFPKPKHPRLEFYNDRREHQLEKLSIISAVARGSNTLEGVDYLRARSWLEEAESNVDDIFNAMAQGDSIDLMRDLFRFLMLASQSRKNQVPQDEVYRWAAGRIPLAQIEQFLQTADSAGVVDVSIVPTAGEQIKYYLPGKDVQTVLNT